MYSRFHDTPVRELDDTAARLSELHIVSDQHQGGVVLAVELEQQLADVMSGALIQIAGRLVSKQHTGLAGECARECDSLLFATAQLPGIMPNAGSESNAV